MSKETKTLRDEFAIAALPSIIMLYDRDGRTFDDISMISYKFADAMIRQREATNE